MPSHQTTTLYRRSNGQPLAIRDDRVIGRGGEGHIYALDTLPDLVAKVYHRPRPRDPTAALKYAEKRAKLALMVDNPPNMPERDGHVSIAWPLDTLHSTRSTSPDTVIGFLMHEIRDVQPVSQCYNPAARKRQFPHYTYKHLCAVAVNIAIAVDAIHDRNYVIGDINESNIMVNDSGLVTLIDTDSFQVIDQSDGKIHRSPVGKPEYTPRELQGHSFDAVNRNQYHDRFGLGVIVYQLLMEGLHPYAGRYTGLGEPPAIEDNIASGHFLHSENRVVPLVDGPGFMRWHTLDESIRELFRLCFERGHDNQIVRPTAFQWEEAITRAVNSFSTCARSSHHFYFGHNSTCPWCERTAIVARARPIFRTSRAGASPHAERDPSGNYQSEHAAPACALPPKWRYEYIASISTATASAVLSKRAPNTIVDKPAPTAGTATDSASRRRRKSGYSQDRSRGLGDSAGYGYSHYRSKPVACPWQHPCSRSTSAAGGGDPTSAHHPDRYATGYRQTAGTSNTTSRTPSQGRNHLHTIADYATIRGSRSACAAYANPRAV